MNKSTHNHALHAARAAHFSLQWSWALSGMMGSATLLVPLMSASESQIQTEAASAASSATAHVSFKIVIPKILSLHVASEHDRTEGAQTVAITSNNRNVMLTASVRTPSGDDAHRNVILNAAARKIIAQDAACTLRDSHLAAASTTTRVGSSPNAPQVICTASMP